MSAMTIQASAPAQTPQLPIAEQERLSTAARFGLVAAATATAAGIGAGVAMLRGGRSAALLGGFVGGAVGGVAALITATVTDSAGRATIGDASVRDTYRVKVGEKRVYHADCYPANDDMNMPCWKTENVYETRWGTFHREIQMRSGVGDAGSLADVAAELAEADKTRVIARTGAGEYQAFRVTDRYGGRIQSAAIDAPGVVAVVQGREGALNVLGWGPDVSDAERAVVLG